MPDKQNIINEYVLALSEANHQLIKFKAENKELRERLQDQQATERVNDADFYRETGEPV